MPSQLERDRTPDPFSGTVLSALAEGGATVSEISDRTGIPAKIVRPLLYRLQKADLVQPERKTHATNAQGERVGGPPANVWVRQF